MRVLPKLAMQLYSGRFFPPLENQLAVVAEAGFTEVEMFDALYDDIALTKQMLVQHGLSARSGHFSIDLLETQPDKAITIAKTFGMEFIVVPYLSSRVRPNNRIGWIDIGRRMQCILEYVNKSSLQLAWHNHEFEFNPLEDGSLPLEHILGENLYWEVDIAWLVRAGADPLVWLNRYRGRVPLVHVKDIAAPGENTDEGGWADVGAGVLSWSDLWKHCLDAGAQVMVAEHDRPSNFDRFTRNSATFMRALVGECNR